MIKLRHITAAEVGYQQKRDRVREINRERENDKL